MWCHGLRVSIIQRAIQDGVSQAADPIIPRRLMNRGLTKYSPGHPGRGWPHLPTWSEIRTEE